MRAGAGALGGRTAGLVAALLTAWVVSACADAGDGAPARDAPAEDAAESSPSAEGTAAAHNTLTPEEEAAGWVLLFDGVSTDGWRGYGRSDFPSGGWAVEDGELVSLSSTGDMDGGDLITEEEFTDFELVFDFKIESESNSGVFYRVREVDGKALWQVAPEYQVLDDTAYIDMGTMDMTTHLTGDNYDLHEASVRPTNPVGSWNTGRIVVDGDHVEHWLNGEMTVAYDLYSDDWEERVANSKFAAEEHYARALSGAIGLQDHGTRIWYRNIKIRPLGG